MKLPVIKPLQWVPLLAVVAMSAPISVAAGAYKWVDDEGNVHYSQQPPDSGTGAAEKLHLQSSPPDTGPSEEELELEQKREQAMEKLEQEKAERRQQEQERAELYKRNCEIATGRLKSLENTGMVRALDEEGNMTRITEEEHQRRIRETRANKEKYCNP